MKAVKSQSFTFRLWKENAKKLDKAKSLGLNGSEIVNEVLEKHLASHLQSKAKAISRELLQPA